MKCIVVAAMAVTLSSGPTLAETEVGSLPAPLETKLRDRLAENLKDPYSAEIRLVRGPWRDKVRIFDRDYAGDFICTSINAKNSYGGYTGFHSYLFIIQDSGNILALTPNGIVSETAAVAAAMCPERGT